MRIIKLSESFYAQMKNCIEILHKSARPYLCVTIVVDNIEYAIPFRHHISHAYCFHTIGDAGIDYSKAIPILNESFISEEKATVELKEWRIIQANEKEVYDGFSRYLAKYRHDARNKGHNSIIVRYSALQYFDI